jgi:carbon starvation protein
MTTVGTTPPRAGTGRRVVSTATWIAVSVVAAVCWGVIALVRDEEISAIWLLGAAVGSYAIAYRFYSRFIAHRVLGVDDGRATPAERLNNAVDHHPTDRRVLLGHHFAAIAGAGPLVGPVLCRADGWIGR